MLRPAANETTDQGPCDRHPPEPTRARKGSSIPTEQPREDPGPQVARRIECPGFEIARGGSNCRHNEANHDCTKIRSGCHGVEFIRDGENSEHLKCGEDDLVEERLGRRNRHTRCGEEDTGCAARRSRMVLRRCVLVVVRVFLGVYDCRACECAERLRYEIGEYFLPGEAAIDCQ